MAGGIDWFRWHHGSVTDPKFGLVAKNSGVRVGDVLAVWAFVLESASTNENRGTVGSIDSEALEFHLGLDGGAVDKILDAMTQRGLLSAEGVILAWEKRQAKREREDSSAERVRAFRERQVTQGEANETHVTPCNANETNITNVTPCNATKHQETPREEKRRGENFKEPTVLVPDPADREPVAVPDRPPPCPTEALVDLYHRHLPMLPRVEVMSDGRRRAISARWRQAVSDKDIAKADDPRRAALEFFDWYFGHAAKSAFLTGKAKNWRADFDFLINPNKFTKVVEGHYHKDST